jgi:hypothetical protein
MAQSHAMRCGDGGDVDDVAQRAERVVCPRVCGQDQRVVDRVRRRDALDARLRRPCGLDDLAETRRLDPFRPGYGGVDLDLEPERARHQRPQVVVVDEELGIVDLDEAVGLERVVGAARVEDEEIEIGEVAGAAGIELRHLRPLDEHERPVARGAEVLEQRLGK